MPRTARVAVPNSPHHVYQQSMGGKVLFRTDKDRKFYLETLREQARQYKSDILAYCLMRDHINLVLIPRKKDSLAKTVGRTHFFYSQYVNTKRSIGAGLWRNRFQSCALDSRQVWTAVQYVECQPVYEGLVRKAEKYPWSSAVSHKKGKDEFGVLALGVWPQTRYRKNWFKMLARPLDEETRDRLRSYTQTGRPFGNPAFVKRLEKKFRRRLHPLPIGRPRKK